MLHVKEDSTRRGKSSEVMGGDDDGEIDPSQVQVEVKYQKKKQQQKEVYGIMGWCREPFQRRYLERHNIAHDRLFFLQKRTAVRHRASDDKDTIETLIMANIYRHQEVL